MSVNQRYDKSEFLAYAMYNIPNASNEDRCSTTMNHAADGIESLASFGVFDGHMGVSSVEVIFFVNAHNMNSYI